MERDVPAAARPDDLDPPPAEVGRRGEDVRLRRPRAERDDGRVFEDEERIGDLVADTPFDEAFLEGGRLGVRDDPEAGDAERRRQMWIARPRAASVASRTASASVGWACMVPMISSAVASIA